jgi:uncharacterized membrane protein
MRNPTTTSGAVLLAVLALFVLDFPIATDAPADQLVVGAVIGVLTLLALATWALGRHRRSAMWIAVVITAFSALAAIPPIFSLETPTWVRVVTVLYVLAAVIGVALVRRELAPSAAPAAAAPPNPRAA